MNKILIIGTPRTGSSNFARSIARDRNCSKIGEIFNHKTFKKRLLRQKIDFTEWETFRNNYKDLDEHEQMVKFQIDYFNSRNNIIAKLFPEHLHRLEEEKMLKYALKLCSCADEIFYTQRLDKKLQTISKSISLLTKEWNEHREPFEGELTDFMLSEVFKEIKDANNKVIDIFKKYSGTIINLDEDDSPYQNRYRYKGDWQLPEELPILK
jgi:hypothetical protein